MNVYMFQAALFCEDCGEKLRASVPLPEGADLENESTFDSDDYPKGPYSHGGGEADTPQHCDNCGLFLENPLTDDGMRYVEEAAAPFATGGADESWDDIATKAEASEDGFKGNGPVVGEWIRFYLAWGQ